MPDPKPKRIAYLTGEYPAMSHTFILREVEALRELGRDVTTCSIRKGGPHAGTAEQDAACSTFYVLEAAKKGLPLLAAQIFALRSPKRYFATLARAWQLRSPGLRAALYQIFYFLEATLLAHHLEKNEVDHLHNHFADSSATVALLAAKLCDIPFSFTLHGPADLQDTQRWRLDAKIAQAKFVSCISYFARSQCMLHSDPKHWHKLWIIRCGVQPELYGADQQSDKSGGDFVFVGRLAAVKGLPVLLEAFTAAHKVNPDLTLTLVGDGPDKATLQKIAAPLGDAVTFTGRLDQTEVANILTRTDVLVLPSFAEGVPVVLMEAMASGLPVIATRVAGVSELVEDGTSGYLVAPGHPEALTEKILTVSSDADLRQRMGQAGQAKVRAGFDVTHEAARLNLLFDDQGGKGPIPAQNA